MHSIVQFLVKNGYRVLFAAVFANQVGLPVPAILAFASDGY
jgi:hypothetical protein